MNRENYSVQEIHLMIIETYNIGDLRFRYITRKRDGSLYLLAVFYKKETILEIIPGPGFFLKCSVSQLEIEYREH